MSDLKILMPVWKLIENSGVGTPNCLSLSISEQSISQNGPTDHQAKHLDLAVGIDGKVLVQA